MRHGRAVALQDQHRPRLLANEPRIESRWGRSCRAFNLCARIDPQAVRALAGVQDVILAAEPSLLRVPREAMHVSAAWLVPVHLELSIPQKDGLWREHGRRWRAVIAEELASQDRFRLLYGDVTATDAAIIALAWPTDEINKLRARLRRRLGLATELSAGDLVHTTLFRYARPFDDPGRLLKTLAGLDVGVEVEVSEFLVVRETVFPALEQDIVACFPLPG